MCHLEGFLFYDWLRFMGMIFIFFLFWIGGYGFDCKNSFIDKRFGFFSFMAMILRKVSGLRGTLFRNFSVSSKILQLSSVLKTLHQVEHTELCVPEFRYMKNSRWIVINKSLTDTIKVEVSLWFFSYVSIYLKCE